MSVRDELVEVIDGYVREIFTVDALADAILARFPVLAKKPHIAYWDQSNDYVHCLTSKDKATHVSRIWYVKEPMPMKEGPA